MGAGQKKAVVEDIAQEKSGSGSTGLVRIVASEGIPPHPLKGWDASVVSKHAGEQLYRYIKHERSVFGREFSSMHRLLQTVEDEHRHEIISVEEITEVLESLDLSMRKQHIERFIQSLDNVKLVGGVRRNQILSLLQIVHKKGKLW